MSYRLFTFPNCGHCTDIKQYLDDKNVRYEEINIGLSVGKKNIFWKKVYLNQQLEKQSNGDLILPILGEFKENNPNH